jgi:hypothetical protein
VQVGLPVVFGAVALGAVLLGLAAPPLLRPHRDGPAREIGAGGGTQ